MGLHFAMRGYTNPLSHLSLACDPEVDILTPGARRPQALGRHLWKGKERPALRCCYGLAALAGATVKSEGMGPGCHGTEAKRAHGEQSKGRAEGLWLGRASRGRLASTEHVSGARHEGPRERRTLASGCFGKGAQPCAESSHPGLLVSAAAPGPLCGPGERGFLAEGHANRPHTGSGVCPSAQPAEAP